MYNSYAEDKVQGLR